MFVYIQSFVYTQKNREVNCQIGKYCISQSWQQWQIWPCIGVRGISGHPWDLRGIILQDKCLSFASPEICLKRLSLLPQGSVWHLKRLASFAFPNRDASILASTFRERANSSCIPALPSTSPHYLQWLQAADLSDFTRSSHQDLNHCSMELQSYFEPPTFKNFAPSQQLPAVSYRN